LKKIIRHIIYPHPIVILFLLPIATLCLVFSLIYLHSTSIFAILSYLLSFYVLTVISIRIPKIAVIFKRVKKENKYIKKWFSDAHLRVYISLCCSLIFNVLFASFQLALGIYHNSFWFFSMFSYYLILAGLRFYLLKHVKKYKTNEKMEIEAKKYVLCGWLLLMMNVVLAVIVFFMVYWNRTFTYHMITTIALALYTFLALTFAIINLVKYKKYKSLIYSAVKNIALIVGLVSMLILETTMLTTFGEGDVFLRQILLIVTGTVIILVATIISINMIIKGNKKIAPKL